MRINRTNIIQVIISTIFIGSAGCLGDRLVDDPFLNSGSITYDTATCDGGVCAASCAEGNCDVDTSGGGTQLGADGYLRGGYDLFLAANATWAPGAVESYNLNTHTGWEEARCFECHGVGMPNEPVDHDPRMQYWPWSCARGFPGSSCHGHGAPDGSREKPNNAPFFNHDYDASFDGCTQSTCHDTYDAPKERENHGFTGAPDSFCNSCHDYYWHQKGWPVDPLAPSSSNKG